MRHHLTSLHESIWDIVEFGAQVPQVGDKDYDSDEATQIWHFNSQATSILLASLCREEYNKVQGLKVAGNLRRPQNGARRGRGDQDHQAGDDQGGARSIRPQQKEKSRKPCTTGSRRWSTKCPTSGAPSGMTME
jgi:hypothetical protein